MATPTAKDEAFGIIPVVPAINGMPRHYLLIFHNKGHWGFPKGHKDGDETDLEAAQRELEEETGLNIYNLVDGLQLSETYQFYSPTGVRIEKTVTYFVALVPLSSSGSLPSITIQVEELADYRWCTLEQGLELISFQEGRRLLKTCEQQLASMIE